MTDLPCNFLTRFTSPTSMSMDRSLAKTPPVAFVVMYYGAWPVWFPAYLRSCETNTAVDWIFITDLPIMPAAPNIHFINMPLEEIKQRCYERVGVVPMIKRMYKLCDLRPFIGLIFSDLLESYAYWGFCDVDIIWGDLTSWLCQALVSEVDIISARKEQVAGHCSFFRNAEPINSIALSHPAAQAALTSVDSYYFDEVGFTEVLKPEVDAGRLLAHWPKLVFNFGGERFFSRIPPSTLGPSRNGWSWKNGKLFDCTQCMPIEVPYLHFMSWKGTMVACDIQYDEHPGQFYISHSHISTSCDYRVNHSWRGIVAAVRLYAKCCRAWVNGNCRA